MTARIERAVGVGIVDDMQLGAADAGGEARPAARARQPEAGGIDQPHRLAELLLRPRPRLPDHVGEETGKHFVRPLGVGVYGLETAFGSAISSAPCPK